MCVASRRGRRLRTGASAPPFYAECPVLGNLSDIEQGACATMVKFSVLGLSAVCPGGVEGVAGNEGFLRSRAAGGERGVEVGAGDGVQLRQPLGQEGGGGPR